ncbi:MAG TPA: lipopolysaccharide heptosyltransferase II [Bacteroidota bacterium]
MKVLIVALSGIGDALMFSPALALLRQRYPDAQVDLLSMFKGVKELYDRNPDVHEVMHWDFLHRSPLSSLLFLLRLRRNGYDATISVYPQNRWPYNLICFLIGAQQRLGHDYDHVNRRSLNFLNNRRIREQRDRHNVEENAKLVEMLGVRLPPDLPPLRIELTPADNAGALEWLRSQHLDEDRVLVGFHAGSALFKKHIRKRWASEKFSALGRLLMKQQRAAILLFGGPEEYALNEHINQEMGGEGYVVKVPSLSTGAALIARCSVMVCNDAGLMHVASALHVPVVSVFAYTNPTWLYPWKTAHRVVRRELECSPCFYYSPRSVHCVWKEDRFRCITHIEVDEVWKAVTDLQEEVRTKGVAQR